MRPAGAPAPRPQRLVEAEGLEPSSPVCNAGALPLCYTPAGRDGRTQTPTSRLRTGSLPPSCGSLVGTVGFEPTAGRLSDDCSTPELRPSGRGGEIRTPGTGHVTPLLSPLSYAHMVRLPLVMKIGTGGRTRTYTGLVLGQVPLPIGLRRYFGGPGRIRTYIVTRF